MVARIRIRFLQRVGDSDAALQLVPAIARSCAMCWEWARPGPGGAANFEIPDAFNEQVECDFIFIYDWIIIHLLDRCTRWHAAVKIPNKEDETLVTGVDQMWMQIHGPPKELIMDGEAGIQLSHSSQQAFMEKGVRLHMRANDMHARYIERRGELFRQAIHKITSDLRQRHLDITPERIIAEAVFCGHALLSTYSSTPYNNVYGRVPRIPGIDDLTVPGKSPHGHFLREAHLLREVNVQAIIEGSARARLLRSEHTTSTVSAAKLNLQLGELVDFYREHLQKRYQDGMDQPRSSISTTKHVELYQSGTSVTSMRLPSAICGST